MSLKSKIQFISLFCTATVFSATTVGCGYRLQGSGSILPPDVQKVAVAPIDNETTEPGLSLELAEAFRSEFERYGVVTIVDDISQSDAVLNARIVSIDNSVRGVTSSTDIELQNDLTLIVSAELRRRSGQLLWKNPRLRARQSVASAGETVVTTSSQFAQGGISSSSLQGLDDREVSRGQRQQALLDLMENISRQAYLEAVAADF